MYCICCKQNKIVPDTTHTNVNKTEEEVLWMKKEREMSDGTKHFETINNQMVSGGIIHIIEAGYGSYLRLTSKSLLFTTRKAFDVSVVFITNNSFITLR